MTDNIRHRGKEYQRGHQAAKKKKKKVFFVCTQNVTSKFDDIEVYKKEF